MYDAALVEGGVRSSGRQNIIAVAERAGGKTRSRCVVGNENIYICISTSAESEFSVSLWDDLMAITG